MRLDGYAAQNLHQFALRCGASVFVDYDYAGRVEVTARPRLVGRLSKMFGAPNTTISLGPKIRAAWEYDDAA
jgi:hypothetical protein